jgi:putative ubiquitin-RnfH superfamily antitoxin RatB of RatAB toxin-antitoxin module
MHSLSVRSKSMGTEATYPVTVVYAPAQREVLEVRLDVETGSTAGAAVRQSGLLDNLPQNVVAALELGIWGRRVPLDHRLQAGDRVELYRPLLVDPKVARRERFVKQGAKSAGLFAKRRDGAKAGY